MRRTYLAIFENEDIAAPVNVMSGEAGEPDPEGNQVAQGNKPEMALNGAVMDFVAHAEGNGSACSSRKQLPAAPL